MHVPIPRDAVAIQDGPGYGESDWLREAPEVRKGLPTCLATPRRRLITRVSSSRCGVPGLNAVGLIAPLPLAGVDANANLMVEGHPAGERQLQNS